jgi:hypothetical protein
MSLNITPIDVSAVTRALVAMLSADSRLEQATIERSAELNEIPGRCPWIGVYRSGVEYPLRTLGMGSGWRQQRLNLMVFVQHADGTSGEECEDRLEGLIVDVIGVLLSDPTLGNTVDTLDEFSVTYLDYSQTDSGYMQTAGIYFTAITSVRA